MECLKIKGLLSEYIDNALDASSKKLVEKHLSMCENCREELESLKICVEELSSLEKVRAPEDFLQKLHERIQPRFNFKDIMRKVFVPMRIKLPLELAGVTAALLLMIAIFNTMKRSEQILIVKGPEEKSTELALKSDVAAPVPRASGLILEEKPIELAFFIESDKKIVERKQSVLGETFDYIAKEKIALKLERKKEAEEEIFTPQHSDRMLLKVKNLIELVEGKILSVEYEKEKDLPQSITAEIPAKNYTLLLEKLGEIGKLQKPLPSIARERKESVPVQIKFIPSE